MSNTSPTSPAEAAIIGVVLALVGGCLLAIGTLISNQKETHEAFLLSGMGIMCLGAGILLCLLMLQNHSNN
jgi:drug/metabolite transporter (DMT)-like permease